MHIRGLTLQNFRNVALATLRFEARRTFLLGPNGQGKTNVLEALGFCTALRSFRGAEGDSLIREGASEAGLGFEFAHDERGDTHLGIVFSRGAKQVTLDRTPLRRLGELMGLFPTVVFCSQDQQLVRGAPGLRRRWMDLALSAADPAYMAVLQTFHRALEGRNALLRAEANERELLAFERTMAPAAAELVRRRVEGLGTLSETLCQSYARVAVTDEQPRLEYQPDWEPSTAEGYLETLAACRERDRRLRTSSCGPHRDDFEFRLQARAARDYASEGQQRLLVIALRLAQGAWLHARTGVRPVMLVDDVAVELDPERRHRFWEWLDPQAQIIATGTVPPEDAAGDWTRLGVHAGEFRPL